MAVPNIEAKLKDLGVKEVVLCGVETHVCVLASCRDLLKKGFNVYVVGDACSSRSDIERRFAVDAMRQLGAIVLGTESVILGMCGDAANPSFKAVQKIIKELNIARL